MQPASLTTTQRQSIASTLASGSAVIDDLAAFLFAYKQEHGDLPPGAGKHGRVKGILEGVKTSEIWVDPDLYVFGEGDKLYTDKESINNLANAALYHTVMKRGIAVRTNIRPLIVVERSNPDPNHPGERLMLLDGYQDLLASKYLPDEWAELDVIVLADMANYDIRRVGLWLRARESAPTMVDLFGHLMKAQEEYQEDHAPDSPPPPDREVAATIGCHRTYIVKLEAAWKSKEIRAAVATKQLAVKTGIMVAERLRDQPDRIPAAVAHITTEGLSAPKAARYLANQTASLKLVSDNAGTEIDALINLFEQVQMVLTQREQRYTTILGANIVQTLREQMQSDILLCQSAKNPTKH